MKILDKSFDITKACSKDDFRPAMKHVYIDVERKQAVTTNGIKLMVQPIEFDENDVLDWGHQQDGKNISRQILIPKDIWYHMIKSKDKEFYLKYRAIQIGNAEYKIDINEKFPPYETAINHDCDHYLILGRKELKELLEGCSSKMVNDQVLFAINFDNCNHVVRPVHVFMYDIDNSVTMSGLIMPCRPNHSEYTYKEFLKQYPKKEVVDEPVKGDSAEADRTEAAA